MKSPVSWCGPVLCCVSLRDVGVAFHSIAQHCKFTLLSSSVMRHLTMQCGSCEARTVVEQCQRPTAPGHGKMCIPAHIYVCFWLTNERLYRKFSGCMPSPSRERRNGVLNLLQRRRNQTNGQRFHDGTWWPNLLGGKIQSPEQRPTRAQHGPTSEPTRSNLHSSRQKKRKTNTP